MEVAENWEKIAEEAILPRFQKECQWISHLAPEKQIEKVQVFLTFLQPLSLQLVKKFALASERLPTLPIGLADFFFFKENLSFPSYIFFFRDLVKKFLQNSDDHVASKLAKFVFKYIVEHNVLQNDDDPQKEPSNLAIALHQKITLHLLKEINIWSIKEQVSQFVAHLNTLYSQNLPFSAALRLASFSASLSCLVDSSDLKKFNTLIKLGKSMDELKKIEEIQKTSFQMLIDDTSKNRLKTQEQVGSLDNRLTFGDYSVSPSVINSTVKSNAEKSSRAINNAL